MNTEITKIAIGGIDVIPGHDPYHRGQCRPTSTVLKIGYHKKNEEPFVWVTQDMDQGATPADEWHGRTWTIDLNTSETDGLDLPDEQALSEYLNSDEGQAILSRIFDGFDIRWDGNNHVGQLTADSNRAIDELIDGIGSLPHHEWQLWDIEDWLQEYRIDSDTTDEEIASLVAELEAEAKSMHIVLDDDIEEWLTEQRNTKRAEETDDDE